MTRPGGTSASSKRYLLTLEEQGLLREVDGHWRLTARSRANRELAPAWRLATVQAPDTLLDTLEAPARAARPRGAGAPEARRVPGPALSLARPRPHARSGRERGEQRLEPIQERRLIAFEDVDDWWGDRSDLVAFDPAVLQELATAGPPSRPGSAERPTPGRRGVRSTRGRHPAAATPGAARDRAPLRGGARSSCRPRRCSSRWRSRPSPRAPIARPRSTPARRSSCSRRRASETATSRPSASTPGPRCSCSSEASRAGAPTPGAERLFALAERPRARPRHAATRLQANAQPRNRAAHPRPTAGWMPGSTPTARRSSSRARQTTPSRSSRSLKARAPARQQSTYATGQRSSRRRARCSRAAAWPSGSTRPRWSSSRGGSTRPWASRSSTSATTARPATCSSERAAPVRQRGSTTTTPGPLLPRAAPDGAGLCGRGRGGLARGDRRLRRGRARARRAGLLPLAARRVGVERDPRQLDVARRRSRRAAGDARREVRLRRAARRRLLGGAPARGGNGGGAAGGRRAPGRSRAGPRLGARRDRDGVPPRPDRARGRAARRRARR